MAYGAALEIGTTDNNNVSIERNGVEKIGVSASEVEFADYINIGDGNDSANLRPLSYKVAQLSSTITILAIGATSDFFIGIPIGRVQAYDVLIQGLDGYWYKEENTHIANSLYHTRLSDVTANDRIQIHVDAGSVNLLGGKVKIIIHYTA